MEIFAQRGGEVVIHAASVSSLDHFSRAYDLVLISAGKGDLVSMFERDPVRSGSGGGGGLRARSLQPPARPRETRSPAVLWRALRRPNPAGIFRRYPEIAIDLHLTDAQTDLIGGGFDAALRIAVMEDSSLIARLIVPVRRFVVASPTYITRYGRPQHPNELGAHQCLT